MSTNDIKVTVTDEGELGRTLDLAKTDPPFMKQQRHLKTPKRPPLAVSAEDTKSKNEAENGVEKTKENLREKSTEDEKILEDYEKTDESKKGGPPQKQPDPKTSKKLSPPKGDSQNVSNDKSTELNVSSDVSKTSTNETISKIAEKELLERAQKQRKADVSLYNPAAENGTNIAKNTDPEMLNSASYNTGKFENVIEEPKSKKKKKQEGNNKSTTKSIITDATTSAPKTSVLMDTPSSPEFEEKSKSFPAGPASLEAQTHALIDSAVKTKDVSDGEPAISSLPSLNSLTGLEFEEDEDDVVTISVETGLLKAVEGPLHLLQPSTEKFLALIRRSKAIQTPDSDDDVALDGDGSIKAQPSLVSSCYDDSKLEGNRSTGTLELSRSGTRGSASSLNKKMVERRSRKGDLTSGSLESVRPLSPDEGLGPPTAGDNLGGSTSSLDLFQTLSRPLGSRGSLCDEAVDDCDSINVVVRCRPLNDKERKRGEESVVTFPGEGQIWINMDGLNGQVIQKPKMFTYNVVFEMESLQADILEHSGITRILDMALDGFSCTVFCYGQTGSGKTHTLTGPPHLFENQPDMCSEEHGLIFRSFVYLFNQLEARPQQEFTIKASYLEIYNEKVIDLLNIGTNNKPLQVRWSKKRRGFFVENLFSIECAELDDLLAVLEEGLRNRAVASHNMNEYSSRSHTILTVTINSEQKADDGVFITKSGKVNFVDLAGSEMTKKTLSEGKTLEEANNINKSLMVLDGVYAIADSVCTVKVSADCVYAIADSVYGEGWCRQCEPKEKLIMNLRKQNQQLLEENQHLRLLLDLAAKNGEMPVGADGIPVVDPTAESVEDAGSSPGDGVKSAKDKSDDPLSRRTSLRLDKEKLEQLEPGELVGLVQHYMQAHDDARKEIKELEELSTLLVRDQELVSKENERLLKKLENSSRARLAGGGSVDGGDGGPAGPTADLWVNPLSSSDGSKASSRGESGGRGVPDSVSRELERRRIGKSMNDLTMSSAGSKSSGGGSSSGGSRGKGGSGGGFRTRAAKELNRRQSDDFEEIDGDFPTQKTKSPSNARRRAKARSQSVPRTSNSRDQGSGGRRRGPSRGTGKRGGRPENKDV
ncbi:Kinesin motor domain [Trinorchestia longiramus]|nr:Kinesin motor domain [Trinorchestia longiramus]